MLRCTVRLGISQSECSLTCGATGTQLVRIAMHFIDQRGHCLGWCQLVDAVAEVEDVAVMIAVRTLRRSSS